MVSRGFLILVSLVLLGSGVLAQESGRPKKKIRGGPLISKRVWPDGREELDILFFLYHHSKGPGGTYRHLAPFYWAGSDTAEDRHWSLLLPLYYKRRDPSGTRLWSPVFDIEDGDGESFWRAPGLLPLYQRHTTDTSRSERSGIPWLLDLHGYHRGEGRRDFSILSLIPGRVPGQGRFGIFQRSRFEDSTRSHLFPVYFYEREPERGSLTIVPALFRRDWSPEGRSYSALLGLVGRGDRGDERWLTLEPFYAWRESPGASAFHVLHLYGRARDENKGVTVHRFLDPLGRLARGHDFSSQRFAPFYFTGKRPGSSYLVVAPFYFGRTTPARTQRLLFPVYWHEGREDGSTTAVVPLYYRSRRGDRTTSIFAPIYYGSREPEKSRQLLLPVYYRSRKGDRSHTTLFPVYSTTRRPGSRLDVVLGPLYVDRRTDGPPASRTRSILWPLVGHRRAGADWGFHILPFLWLDHRGKSSFDLVAPLYLRVKDENRSHHWVVPVFGRAARKRPDGGEKSWSFYGAGTVITGSETAPTGKTERRTLSVLGPLLLRRTETTPTPRSRLSILWPLFVKERSEGSRHLHALPLVWFTRTNERELDVIAPLYWRSRTPELDWTLLAPLWFSRERREGDTARRLTMLGPNLWLEMERGTRRERGVLWPFSRAITDGGTRQFDALLLFSRRADESGARRLRASPLYSSTRGEPRSDAWWWWHLFSRQTDDRGSRTRVMPFLFEREIRGDERSTTGPLWLVGSQWAPEASSRWALPLYFHRQTRDTDGAMQSEILVTLPIYMHLIADKGGRRTRSILPPFYFHTRDEASGLRRHSLLLGAIAHERSDTGSAARVLPLWATRRSDSGERSWQLFPFYSTRRSPGEVEGSFSPDGYWGLQLVRRSRGTHTRTFTLNPLLFSRHVDDREDRSSWNSLLFAAQGWRRGARSSFHVLGLVRGREDLTESRWSAWPLVHSQELKAERAPGFQIARLTHVFWQSKGPRTRRWSVLGPILFASGCSGPGDDGDLRIFHRLAEFSKQGAYRERSMWPFFAWEHDADSGYEYFSIGEILYRSERETRDAPVKRRVLLFPL